MTMPPLAVRVVPVGGTLPRAVGSAAVKHGARRGVALILDDGRGARGLGEASPLPGRSAETLAEVVAALSALDGRMLAGVAAELARAPLPVAAALGELTSRPALPSSARFAMETALLDLVGRRRGLSVAALLGARADASAGLQRVGEAGAGAAALLEAAERLVSDGGSALKVKIGGRDFAGELAALAALRAAFPSLTLRLDANRAFGVGEAETRARQLATFRPAFLEEPTRGGLGAVAWAVPIAADESLSDAPDDVLALLAARRLAAIVVKPEEVGGMAAALVWARRATAAGAGVVVSHLWDGPIALTACAHLALAVAPPPDEGRAIAGLAAHAGLDVWPGVALPLHRERPLSLSLAGAPPGLGLARAFEAALLDAPPTETQP